MSKKCILVDASLPASVLQPELDWKECFLCQQRTAEKLVCPDRSKRQDSIAGYQSLVDILLEFEKIGELPSHLVPARLDDGSGLASTLQSQNARWHKTCRSQFCARELNRRSKRAEKRSMSASEDDSCVTDESVNASLPPVKRYTRSEHDSSTNPQVELCFFCDLPADQQHLHAITTFDLDARVKECAGVLGDNRLLAKLAVGDMIALEAKYHSRCLAHLYNRRRSLERQHYKVISDNATDSQHSNESIVFAQLIAYIDDVRSCDIIPVFKLADLKNLYLTRLNQLNQSNFNTVNSSRLKEKLLAYYPDMRAQSDGRDVLLAFDDNLGAALSRACVGDMDEDAMHLIKAAEVVRREIFDCKWQFGTSLSHEAQLSSVPSALLCLVRMILEGPGIDVQSLHQHTPASLSIAQLLVFNSVHHKRTSVTQACNTGCKAL